MTDRHQDRQAPEGEAVGGVPVDQMFDVLSGHSGRIKEVSRQVWWRFGFDAERFEEPI
jgi:hypothetical protein